MTAETFHYRVYGLTVASDFPLQEVDRCAPARPDVRVRHGSVPSIAGTGNGFRTYRAQPGVDILEYRDLGRFRVSGGGEITFDPHDGFDLRLLGLALLGPVFALLLHRRGMLVLHASAVAIDGEAHVFLGDKGAGKSTTAAALLAAGFPLVADDVVALDPSAAGPPAIHSAFPAMKLDAAMLAGFPENTYRILEPDGEPYTHGKLRVRWLRALPDAPVGVARLNWLVRGTDHAFEPFCAADVLRTLIRFSYYPRFDGDALAASETAAIFARAAALAPRIAAGRLTVKESRPCEIASIAEFVAKGHMLAAARI